MSEHIFKLFDSYSLRARLMPALFTLLPGTLAVAAWFPEKLAVLGTLLGFVAIFGATNFLSEWLRDCGKALERKLIAEWGGLPSTIILRHRDSHLNPETKARYHRRLASLLPGLVLPSPANEAAHPESADRVYASCGDFLREQTRDPARFGLLLSENIQYGARRNLLAAKHAAMWIAIPALLSCGGASAVSYQHSWPIEVPFTCTLVCFACLLIWLFRVNPAWVRTTAFCYAERLLAS